MDNEQLALRLQETTDRSVRNEGRIKKLEAEHEALRELTTSVAIMAEQLKTMSNSVDTLADKVDTLEDKPGKRWDGLVDKVILVVATAIITCFLARLGVG